MTSSLPSSVTSHPRDSYSRTSSSCGRCAAARRIPRSGRRTGTRQTDSPGPIAPPGARDRSRPSGSTATRRRDPTPRPSRVPRLTRTAAPPRGTICCPAPRPRRPGPTTIGVRPRWRCSTTTRDDRTTRVAAGNHAEPPVRPHVVLVGPRVRVRTDREEIPLHDGDVAAGVDPLTTGAPSFGTIASAGVVVRGKPASSKSPRRYAAEVHAVHPVPARREPQHVHRLCRTAGRTRLGEPGGDVTPSPRSEFYAL